MSIENAMVQHSAPSHDSRSGGSDRLVRAYAGTLAPRGHVAPTDLTRSLRHGVAVRECPECGGPWLREDRGGPAIRHTRACSVPPRPRSWPKRPLAL